MPYGKSLRNVILRSWLDRILTSGFNFERVKHIYYLVFVRSTSSRWCSKGRIISRAPIWLQSAGLVYLSRRFRVVSRW